MPDSMTGFGRAFCDAADGKLIVEIQSVNRKYLEIFVSLPKEFSYYEHDIRKWVSEKVSRGQITVRVHLLSHPQSLLPNLSALKTLKKKWEKHASELGYSTDSITLPFLTQYLPTIPSSPESLPQLRKSVTAALKALLAMKQKEGKALARDLSQKLSLLKKHTTSIRTLSPQLIERMKERLQEKLQQALASFLDKEIQDRLLRESFLLAEKSDITEELTRLDSHFVQFQELLSSSSSGKKMDFLTQEIGREINTISAKSADIHISRLVIEMKSELEKMREQIQNIE